MALLRRMYGKLCLTINGTKSAVTSAFGRKFLGYDLWVAPRGEAKHGVSAKSLATFERRVGQLTRRSGSRSMEQVAQGLRHMCPSSGCSVPQVGMGSTVPPLVARKGVARGTKRIASGSAEQR